jgi:hypothetical protein
MRITEELIQGNSGSGLEIRKYRPWGFVALITRHPLAAKFDTKFTDKRRSLGWYSLLAGLKLWSYFCLYDWEQFVG